MNMGLITPKSFQFNFLLVFVLYHLSFIYLSELTEAKQLCRNEEKVALLQFKKYFSVNESLAKCIWPRPNLISWKEDDKDCCSAWEGVTCDRVTGHVIVLDLTRACLCGTIPPNSTLFNLVHLQKLHLGGNYFTNSQISPLFGRFRNLTSLKLQDSEFSGVVPNEIFQLSKLRFLYLSRNPRLTVKISNFNASELVNLYLSGIHVTRDSLDSIGQLKSLQALGLASCNILGPLPASLGNLTKIVALNLGKNQFSGNIPSSLSNLPYLSNLDLSYNNLQGPIPHSLANLTRLLQLRLDENVLVGQLPSDIFKISGLSELNLTGNRLNGSIDLQMFTGFKNLEYLDLSNSGLSLTSSNSNIISAFPLIRFLGLSSCNITTSIPPQHNYLNESPYIDLSIICNLQSLEYLDLSNNQLRGLIPTCSNESARSLYVINLRNNNLYGTIPESFGYFSNLQTLDLSNNGLQGVLPRSLVNCTLLEVLNLGGNMLTDGFPFWLQNLPSLKVLVLRDNNFYGKIIGKEPNSFAKLHVIDMSHNNFTGIFPSKYFESWNSMFVDKDASTYIYMESSTNYYFYSVEIVNKGMYLHYERVLNTLKVIDFSNNMFHGNIPVSIGRLKGLQVLSFSRNVFTGPIPLSLRNLKNIESLDLSNNKLSGEIPQELKSLTFLQFFDVSQNNLTGMIPSGGKLGTFPSASYEGNPGLCGLPLSKLCRNHDSPTSPLHRSHHFKFKIDGFGWEVVLMGYACGLVVGLVIGCCIIQRKSEWLEQTFRVKMRQHGKRSKKQRS